MKVKIEVDDKNQENAETLKDEILFELLARHPQAKISSSGNVAELRI